MKNNNPHAACRPNRDGPHPQLTNGDRHLGLGSRQSSTLTGALDPGPTFRLASGANIEPRSSVRGTEREVRQENRSTDSVWVRAENADAAHDAFSEWLAHVEAGRVG